MVRGAIQCRFVSDLSLDCCFWVVGGNLLVIANDFYNVSLAL